MSVASTAWVGHGEPLEVEHGSAEPYEWLTIVLGEEKLTLIFAGTHYNGASLALHQLVESGRREIARICGGTP